MNEGKKGLSRRELLSGAASLAAEAVADASLNAVEAQYDVTLGADGKPVDFRNDRNVVFDGDKIVEFYGIRREDVQSLPGHPMSGEDPYVGYRNKRNLSCCNVHDCGPAIINRIGTRQNGEGIFAFGIKINGEPTFALTVPSTGIYTDHSLPGGYPNHGCIYGGEAMCLFMDTGL